jgi:hypothetical protein
MYADSLSVAEARDVYFKENGFSAAGYTDAWVKLKLGPIPLGFPNSPARQAAVPLHDLHHVATGYATTWTGEAEIGAWEIAAGCGRYWAAWFLNLGAFFIGLWIAPLRTFRAFVRGRRSRSLYSRAYGEDLLKLRVGELRDQLGLNQATGSGATAGDVVVFGVWKLAALVTAAAMLAPPAVAVWWLWLR